MPNASDRWDNLFTRILLDGWQISGVRIFQSENRAGFSYGFTGAPTDDLSGNGYARRVSLSCDPNLPRSERTFDRQFRTECVRPGGGPGDPFYMGTSTDDEYHPPGFINHDMTLFKNFMIGSKALQFRAELYNAFNLTQYEGVDTARPSTSPPASRPTPTSAASPACAPTRTASSSSECGSGSRRKLSAVSFQLSVPAQAGAGSWRLAVVS